MQDFKFVWLDYEYNPHYEETFDDALDSVFDYILSIDKPDGVQLEFILSRDKEKDLSRIQIFRLIPNFFDRDNWVFVVNVCVKF